MYVLGIKLEIEGKLDESCVYGNNESSIFT